MAEGLGRRMPRRRRGRKGTEGTRVVVVGVATGAVSGAGAKRRNECGGGQTNRRQKSSGQGETRSEARRRRRRRRRRRDSGAARLPMGLASANPAAVAGQGVLRIALECIV